MGSVFRARHVETGKEVALKVVRVDLAARRALPPALPARGPRGLRGRPPQPVDVLDAGEVDGRQFLAMRFVRGRRLEQHISDGALEPARIVRVAAELGGAPRRAARGWPDPPRRQGVEHHARRRRGRRGSR